MKVPILVYAFLAFLIMLPLLGPGYFLALDMQWGPNTFSDFQFGDFYGVSPSPYGATLPFKFVFAALSSVIGVEILEKALLFFILFLCGASMHFSLPKELGNARYLGGLFYLFNPYTYIRFLAGHWTVLLSYAVLPLAVSSFYGFLQKPDKKNIIRTALITAFAAVSSHGILMLLLVYAILFTVFIFLKAKSEKLLIRRTAILAAMVLALNLFWIVPTFLLFDQTYSPAGADAYIQDFGAKSYDMSQGAGILTLHGFWRGGFTFTKDVFDLWYVPFALLFLFSAFGFLNMLKKDTTHAISLLFVFLVAFFLAMGISMPALLENLVYFIFRDTQKFVGLLAFVYAVFASYGLHEFLKRFKNPGIILVLALLLPLIYTPAFIGFLGQIGPTHYPDSWAEAEKIISADDIPGKIITIPSNLYYPYLWVNGTQKTLGSPASQFFSKPIVTGSAIQTMHIASDIKDPYSLYISEMFNKRQRINSTAEALLPLDARYVILFKTRNDYIHYLYLFYRAGGVEDIELVYESDDLYLFRNNLLQGPFITSQNNGSGTLDLAKKGVFSPDVEYEEITPAKYRILDSSSQYIVYTQPYNGFISYDSGQVSKWYLFGTGFEFSKNGIIENRMFYIVAGLFILAWMLALVLLLGPSQKIAVIFLAIGLILFFMISEGYLGPKALGALMMLSSLVGLKCLIKK